MPHRWRESLKSFFGSHMDPKKDEEFRRDKADVDGKVEKILKFLKEDQNDREEPLSDLMEDFRNHYQRLYEHYEHLTEAMREKAQGKHGPNSSSSSSDSSDSDDSSKKKSKRNGKVQGDFKNDAATIEQELKLAHLEVDDLKRELAAAVHEKAALSLEHQRILSQVQEAQGLVMDLKTEVEKCNQTKMELLFENAELIQKLEEMNREQENLVTWKEATLVRIEESNRDVEELRSLNDQLQMRSTEMKGALVEKENEFSNVQKQHEDVEGEASAQIVALTEEIKSLQELLSAQKSEAELDHEKNKEEISEFLIQIEKMKEELSKKSDDVERVLEQNESLEVKLKDLAEKFDSLQQHLESLQSEKIQLEGKLEGSNQEHTEFLEKITEQERKLQEQDDAYVKLSEEHKDLEIKFQNCQESLKSSEKKIEEITEQFHREIEAKNQEIYQLEINVEDLRTDLEMKVDEMSTLIENMRTTEVKQRLTSQKLRITEQVLGDQEETHRKRVEKLQEEQKVLEDRITILSQIIDVYKKAQLNLMTEISDKMNDTLMAIDTFSMKYEEDHGHLESRIYEIRNELRGAIAWITENNAEKDELKREIAILLQQLKEEKEQVLLLDIKIKELETALRNNENERVSLTGNMKCCQEKIEELGTMIQEGDRRIGELESKMNEKDNGILNLGEEKREAIRQLCIWIDYHHNRYDELKDVIMKKRGGRRQIAA